MNIRRTAGNHGNGYLVSLVRRELLSLRPTKPDCGQIQRYFLQASKELEGSGIELYKAGLPETPGIAAFLLRNLNENETVGLDGQTYSVADAVELNSVLKKKENLAGCFKRFNPPF